MVSERTQRQIDRLLDDAEEAIRQLAWETVRARVQAVLSLDPENTDAHNYLAAADRNVSAAGYGSAPEPEATSQPTSFANGRYQVKRLLGEGGKKRVYLAHDSRLDRDVAFALIKTEGLDDEGRERIEREAQAMGKLGTHPHIVSVFDIGVEGTEGAPYLVTELMGGGDVEALIEKAPEHRLSIGQAVETTVQVCRGLEFAHSNGLVHRDLKPGNVWLTSDGTAKIGDFGLAVALDRSRLTVAGMMVGTVSYMPPEQAMGGEVTPRSDLYSLGAMLYEMVCGRPPFVGDETVAIIGQHLNTSPVAPTWHNSECPPGLEALVLQLLEKDPNKRPASAEDVLQALGSVQARANTPTARTAEAAAPVHDPLYQRVFVGREQEMRQLSGAFDAAISGRGGLAMVVGEPGIGKTSVCEQLATYVALRGGKTLVGHCYEEGSLSLPYLPFVEALRSYVLSREPEELKKELGTGATEMARIVSEVRDRVQVSPSEGGDPQEQRWRLLQAVTGFLRNASQVQPLLIILEDLHDADRGTLDLLMHLSRSLPGTRLLIVGTYRDVEVDRAHPLSSALAELRRSSNFLRVPLRGLTVDEVQRMMTAIRGQEVPWSRAEAVHRQTEGNPLFVQEVLRYLVEEGIVVRQGDRYVLTDPSGPDAGIPEGLKDVIGKRLSRLSEKANQLLSIASVIGREFRLDVLQTVAGLPDEDLDAALEEASERSLIEERQSVGTLGFRFTHAFFRQTLYDELFASRRLRIHQQVARALELTYGTRVADHAAELAEHYAQSTDAADLEKALHYSEVAAERAMAVYAYGEAVRHVEQAVKVQEVLDPDDRTKRCDLLLTLGHALMPAGEPLRVAETVAREALAMAEAAGDETRASRACQLALLALRRYGRFLVAHEPFFREWVAAADRYAAPGTSDRVYADLCLALVARVSGERRRTRELANRALEEARRLDDPEAMFSAVQEITVGRPDLEHAQAQFDLVQEFIARPRNGLSVRTVGELLSTSAGYYLLWGDRDRAESLFGELQALAARTGDPVLLSGSRTRDAILAILDGRVEEAAERAYVRKRELEESGHTVAAQSSIVSGCARAFFLLGRGPELMEFVPPQATLPPVQYPNYALCLAYAGRSQEAVRYVELGEGALGDESPVEYVACLAEAALVCGDRDWLRRLVPKIDGQIEILTQNGLGPLALARLLGEAVAVLGEPERAMAYYQRALRVCYEIRFRPEIALTRLATAELQLIHYPDQHPKAIGHLDFAIAEFQEMKMQPSLERALKHKGLLHA